MLGVLAVAQIHAAEIKWTTDLPKAMETAKAEKKLVLIDFTGSDWCGWCIKLDKEVFAKQEFIDYAEKNLVSVKIDFPRKAAQSAELKKANRALQEKYNIEGYPTIVVLDAEGKEIGRSGYRPGPKAFIDDIEKIKTKK
jgi:protein disulfide-isomerase